MDMFGAHRVEHTGQNRDNSSILRKEDEENEQRSAIRIKNQSDKEGATHPVGWGAIMSRPDVTGSCS